VEKLKDNSTRPQSKESLNTTSGGFRLLILLPVMDDWSSAALLIQKIDDILEAETIKSSILIVDDGSTQPFSHELFSKPLRHIESLEILRLRRNVGHQRAIAIGLTFIYEKRMCDAVLVMDADGEDRPVDMPKLLKRFKANKGQKAVFAHRLKRSEGLVFGFFYRLYRILHYILTGIPVRIGNFSIVPFARLATLAVVSELWNHYAAAVFRAGIPFETVPTARGYRLSGKSKMNFVNFVTHGLSAISVFSEIMGARVLIFVFIMTLFLICLLFSIFLVRFFTNLAIPGWATYSTGLIIIIMFQIFTVAGGFLFFILNSRNNLGFIPLRDYKFFIDRVWEVDLRHE
jgi:glycosyltransferase involved in cell wall biosynthesis